MCEMCDPAFQLAVDVMLGQMEREIAFAEAQAGLSPSYARRPLSRAERASKVRFSEIQEIEDEFLARVEPILERLHGAAAEAILAALPTHLRTREISARELVDALDELTRNQPGAVAAAVENAIPEIEAALAATYVASGGVVKREARRQGVDAVLPVPRPSDAQFYPVAKIAALEPYRRLLTGVQDKVATPGALAGGFITDDTIVGMLGEMTPASAIDQARQANHGAINGGRIATARGMALDYAYASELLDAATCESCERVDGREYETLAEAEADYPSGGGYVRCDGGARCRGTVVFVFRK